jgi:ribosomal protein L7/L12
VREVTSLASRRPRPVEAAPGSVVKEGVSKGRGRGSIKKKFAEAGASVELK